MSSRFCKRAFAQIGKTRVLKFRLKNRENKNKHTQNDRRDARAYGRKCLQRSCLLDKRQHRQLNIEYWSQHATAIRYREGPGFKRPCETKNSDTPWKW